MSREALLFDANVRLNGPINGDSAASMLEQLRACRDHSGPIIIEVTTEGGDAAARRIALEIKLLREQLSRETIFVGKSYVYSAGMTIMGAFPRAQRFLTADTTVLIHERRLTKKLKLDGPVSANVQLITEQLNMLKAAQRLKADGFAELATGSSLSGEALFAKAQSNLYLTATQALDLGLIESVL